MRPLGFFRLFAVFFVVGCARAATGEFDRFDAAATLLGSDAGPFSADAGEGPVSATADLDSGPLPDAGREIAVLNARGGRYAVRRIYQQLQMINGSLIGIALNGTLLNTNTVYSLGTIHGDGTFEEQLCGIDILSKDGDGRSALFESTITPNPGIYDYLPLIKHPIEIRSDGWTLPESFMAVGWTAASATDPIPTDKADPRVFDLDQDGKPGITVRLSDNTFASGELYAVQSIRYRAQGVFEGDHLVGQNFDSGEQEVLDGTIVDTQQRVQNAGNSSTNRMHLMKLAEGDALTCKQLVADPAAFFPAHPVPGA